MAGRHRNVPSLERALVRVPAVAVALAALAATLVTVVALAAPGTQAGPALAAGLATASVLAFVLTAARPTAVPVRVRSPRAGTPAERVEAPTPFWCAVEVCARPSRPRAPGGR